MKSKRRMVGYAFLCWMPITIFEKVDSKIFKRCDHFKISAVQIKIMTCESAFFKDHGFSFRGVYF